MGQEFWVTFEIEFKEFLNCFWAENFTLWGKLKVQEVNKLFLESFKFHHNRLMKFLGIFVRTHSLASPTLIPPQSFVKSLCDFNNSQ